MEPQCFTCTNCHLIASVYEAASRQGHEADWFEVGPAYPVGTLWCIQVWDISQDDLMSLVNEVRSGQRVLPLAA